VLDKSNVIDTPGAIWVDNFSAIFGCNKVTLKHGTYKDCLWTVIGHTSFAGDDPSCSLSVGSILSPANPDSLDDVKGHVLTALHKRDRESSLYFDSSLVKKHCVTRIPPKPRHTSGDLSEANDKLLDHIDGLKHFTPIEILPHNPASDSGLFKILLDLRSRLNSAKFANKYLVIKCDVNIYMRVLPVRQLICISSARPSPGTS